MMASTIGMPLLLIPPSSSTTTTSSSSRLVRTFSKDATHLSVLSQPRPISTSSFLFPAIPPKRKSLGAAAAEEAPEVAEEEEEEEQPSEPEPVEAQIAEAAAAEAPKGEDVFAVVVIGSRQYIVFPGRFLHTQRLKDANVNDKIILNKVLLVGTRTKTYIGQPVVTNAAVHAVVEEQGLDKKVIVYKYKKKKNYRRNIGHRQPNTRIRITGITGYEDFPAETMPEAVPA
ncbi:50S ribosomal protein L21 [Iris pallida]|uniref:50S ribosomal protein L21 n=1 Tax=Iris pallida TaxID=29817 RepID=A0AAX6DUS0_IRIPA|nr:50S ribosomal protein L21 [Iris pallida]